MRSLRQGLKRTYIYTRPAPPRPAFLFPLATLVRLLALPFLFFFDLPSPGCLECFSMFSGDSQLGNGVYLAAQQQQQQQQQAAQQQQQQQAEQQQQQQQEEQRQQQQQAEQQQQQQQQPADVEDDGYVEILRVVPAPQHVENEDNEDDDVIIFGEVPAPNEAATQRAPAPDGLPDKTLDADGG
eukprot:366182-Chlamydomonas_euryale.AAC.19